MKTKIIFLSFFICINIYSQHDFKCVQDAVNNQHKSIVIGRAVYNVAVCYVNFADGFLPNGSMPLTNNDLNSVNIESICRVGYKKSGSQMIKTANKYDYDDAWDRNFATNNEYARGVYFEQRHPDYNDYDHNKVNAYGSFTNWVNEISNGNLTINPFPVPRTGFSGVYAKGIVNNILVYGGRKLIVPIKLPHPRSYYDDFQPVDFLKQVRADAISKLASMNSNGEINFDVDGYIDNLSNIFIVVFAGTKGIAMASGAPGNLIIFGEKPGNNIDNAYSFLSGITAESHEFGHCIGWLHTNAGPYCVMNPNGRMNNDCPPHPNIIFKLQANWIDNSHIRTIRTNGQVADIPPVLANGDCAVVTIYGKPGYNNDWKNHSEYAVLENRRKNSFDRFITGLNNIYVPGNFTGGCLIWKYSPYNNFSQDIDSNSSMVNYNIKLVTANGFERFTYSSDVQSLGNPEHFWGVPVNAQNQTYNDCNGTKTNSSFELQTGINITGINGAYSSPNNLLKFNVLYSFGTPPDYTAVLMGPPLDAPLTLNGTYFYGDGLPSRFVNITPGTVIDFPSNTLSLSGTETNPANIIAEGTPENPITFQGCGFSDGMNDYKCKFGGIHVFYRGITPGFNSTIFSNCIFKNNTDKVSLIISGNSNPDNIPIIIKDNNFTDKIGTILVTSTAASFLIDNISGNINSLVSIMCNSTHPFYVNNLLQVPEGLKLYIHSNTKLLFSDSADFIVNGEVDATGLQSQEIIFDKAENSQSWKGVSINGGFGTLKYCKINNAVIGIDNYFSPSSTSIENCSFTGNQIYDIRLKLIMQNSSVIDHCTFTGNNNQKASIVCVDAGNINIEYNNFINEYGNAIFFNSVHNSQINENNIQGAEVSGNSSGIFLNSSIVQVMCSNITGYAVGLFMDASSPVLYNNNVWGNRIGLFMQNGAAPVLTQYNDGKIISQNAGYNKIYNNLNEEILCDNSYPLPLSLPLLQNGYNNIYDEVNTGCLIDVDYNDKTFCMAENNYWGTSVQSNQFCGSIDHEPFLSSISTPPVNCLSELKDGEGSYNMSGKNGESKIPKVFSIEQNYPNPFNPLTSIKYSVPKPGLVKMVIYDLLGREVKELVNEIKHTGSYNVIFDASSLASGVYIYRMDAGDFNDVKKMVLIK